MSSFNSKFINVSHQYVKTKFDLFRKYTKDLESSIHNIEIEMIEEYENMTQGLTKQEIDEFWAFHTDDHSEINKEYPNLLRGNTLTNAYSYFEKSLIDNHTMLKGAVSTSLFPNPKDLNSKSIKKMRGSTIEKLEQCFLDISFSFPSGTEWERILQYKDIRNNIIHNGGIVENSSVLTDKVVIAINNLNHVRVSPKSKRIMFDEEFSNDVFVTMTDFYDKLFQEIRKYVQTHNL